MRRDQLRSPASDPSNVSSSSKTQNIPRIRPYAQALQQIAVRTGAPLPSLIASFAILHEATAIIPFVGIFFISRSLGVGDTALQYVKTDRSADPDTLTGGALIKLQEWTVEGEQWVARVGSRYGLWGFEKGVKGQEVPSHLVGDVANAVLAYGVTKVRIYL